MSVRIPLSSQKFNAILKKFKDGNLSNIPLSDIEFLQELSENNRFRFNHDNNFTGDGTIFTRTPDTGTTYFFSC